VAAAEGSRLRATAAYALAKFIHMCDVAGPHFSVADAPAAHHWGQSFLLSYCRLAELASAAEEADWKLRPKAHMVARGLTRRGMDGSRGPRGRGRAGVLMAALCVGTAEAHQVADVLHFRRNPRHVQSCGDEDFMGKMAGLAARTHQGTTMAEPLSYLQARETNTKHATAVIHKTCYRRHTQHYMPAEAARVRQRYRLVLSLHWRG